MNASRAREITDDYPNLLFRQNMRHIEFEIAFHSIARGWCDIEEDYFTPGISETLYKDGYTLTTLPQSLLSRIFRCPKMVRISW